MGPPPNTGTQNATPQPAPQPRAPVFTPTSSFSSQPAPPGSAQGQTPFNAAPGFSPTKQASPKTGGTSPRIPSGSAVASPAGAHFNPPTQAGASGVSPVKHDLPPSSPPLPSSSAGLGLGQANVAGSFRVSDGNGNLGELAGARRSVSASEAPAKELVGANPALEGNKPVLQ